MSELVYPLAVANGKLVLTDSYETVARQHIIHALDTKLEELLMLPEYGSPIAAFMTVADLPTFLRELKEAIMLSLTQFKDVFIDVTGGFTTDGQLDVSIEYSIEDLEKASIQRLIDLGFG